MQKITRYSLTFLALVAIIPAVSACGGGSESENPAVISGSTEVRSLKVIDTVIGTGATATTGHEITVDYTGWLYDVSDPEFHGAEFDSTVGGSPFTFQLGTGEVISGWDQGLIGMKVGGQRTLIIPAGLAYGRQGNGPIPPNAALVFDVELVDVN